MADAFARSADSVFAPATDAVAVTPHDTNPLANIPTALFIGTGGTVILRGVNGAADATFTNVANGTVLPIRASHVRATGTTASGIVALF